jgi:hypothetical protein
MVDGSSAGKRFVAISTELEVMQMMMRGDWLGKRVAVSTDSNGRGIFAAAGPPKMARL